MKKRMEILGYFKVPVKVVEGDMSCMQDINTYTLDVMDLLNEMLLGFNEDVQLEMVENMLSFICANVLHTTGCYSVDTALELCYKWIGDEKGIATKGFAKLLNRIV